VHSSKTVYVSRLVHLAQRKLEEEEGGHDEDDGDEVGDEEGTAAPTVRKIGEAPDVAEAD